MNKELKYWLLEINNNLHIIPASGTEEVDRIHATLVKTRPEEDWVAVLGGGWSYAIAKKELEIMTLVKKEDRLTVGEKKELKRMIEEMDYNE